MAKKEKEYNKSLLKLQTIPRAEKKKKKKTRVSEKYLVYISLGEKK